MLFCLLCAQEDAVSALPWEDSAVILLLQGYRMLVCQMRPHGLNQVLTFTVAFDSVRGINLQRLRAIILE